MSAQTLVPGGGPSHAINGFSDDLHLEVVRQQVVPMSIGQLETGVNDSVFYHDAYDGRMVFLLVDMSHPMTMAPVIRPSFQQAGDFDMASAQPGWATVDVANGLPPQSTQMPQGIGGIGFGLSPIEGWLTQ